MSDLNEAQQRYNELLDQARDSLAQGIPLQTAQKEELKKAAETLKKATETQERNTKALDAGSKVIGGLTGSALAAGKALYSGAQGATAFNSSLDQLNTAVVEAGKGLAQFAGGGFIVKALIGGLTMLASATIKQQQAAAAFAEKLNTGYNKLSEAGAAASGGMSEVFASAQKLGLGIDKLDTMVGLVADNSQTLALMSGSVAKGTQDFADLSDSLKGSRKEFLNLGINQDQQNEGMMRFVKNMTLAGRAQNMSTADMTKGAKELIYEQDKLAKLTGINAKEQQKLVDRSRENEQFNSKIQSLEAEGSEQSLKAAQSLRSGLTYFKTLGEDALEGFMGAVNKNLVNPRTQAMFVSSGSKLFETVEDMLAGGDAFTAYMKSVKGIAEFNKSVGNTMSSLDAGNDRFLNSQTQVNAVIQDGLGLEKAKQKIEADTAAQAAGKDKITNQYTDIVLKNQQSMLDMQNSMFQVLERNLKVTENQAEMGAELATVFGDIIYKISKELTPVLDNLIKGLTEFVKLISKILGDTDKSAKRDKAEERLDDIQKNKGWFDKLTPGLGDATSKKALSDYQKAYDDRVEERNAMMLDTIKSWLGFKSSEPKVEGARAEGGPVDAGKLYKVGEHGQEYFKPKIAGDIIPNDVTTGMAADKARMSQFYKEILKDTEALEKLTDTDLRRTRDFNDLSKTLIDKKTKLIKEEIELLDEQNDAIEKTATLIEQLFNKEQAAAFRKMSTGMRTMGGMMGGGMPNMGGGQGLQMPGTGNRATMGGAQGLQITNQDDLKKSGLNVKSGDVHAENSGISSKLIELAKTIQSGVPGFGYFSAFNDRFHQEKAPSSKHTQGLAADFTTAQAPSAKDGEAITQWLKQMGASMAIDEYNNPSSKSTAGHFHVEIPAFEEGGNLGAGKVGIAGENGKPELITGPATITPMNDLVGTFNTMVGLMGQQVSMMDEMIRAQKNGNDISTKILRVQQ